MLHTLRANTRTLLQQYLSIFPAERDALRQFELQLEESGDCFHRSNMTGHVTTSAAVLSPDHSKILLIHHKFLDKWLPPGGHYEGSGDFWSSAAREVEEETGVHQLRLHSWCVQHGVPFDIDTHAVPENPAKQEGAHFHHDLRFLAIARYEDELLPQLAEVHAARWAPLNELYGMPDVRLVRLAQKLQSMF
jgi:8-oxo-dGTP pyrophosphatase MutT (NUDIX family)